MSGFCEHPGMTNQRASWRTAVCGFKRPSIGSKIVHCNLIEESTKILSQYYDSIFQWNMAIVT